MLAERTAEVWTRAQTEPLPSAPDQRYFLRLHLEPTCQPAAEGLVEAGPSPEAMWDSLRQPQASDCVSRISIALFGLLREWCPPTDKRREAASRAGNTSNGFISGFNHEANVRLVRARAGSVVGADVGLEHLSEPTVQGERYEVADT